MRKLSMKGKRRKSETSDGESEENGVASGVTRASDNEVDETASERSETASRKSKSNSKKRLSRSRGKINEQPPDETTENEDQEKPAGNDQENGTVNVKGGSSKRRKKEEKVAVSSQSEEKEDDEEYEVEKVVAQRTIKGRRQFLVRWKGYGEDSDTWEQEKDLNCSQLIEEFLAETAEDESTEKTLKSPKNKHGKKSSKKAKKVNEPKNNEKADDEKNEEKDDENDDDGDTEFEVERIIEVHFKKNKSREFLIRWKGFSASDDTWEPEENLNCPDLIEKFMEKVEKAKKTDMRELRTNPTLTKHYTLSAHGRRHSRRHVDKQRVTYQGCDE